MENEMENEISKARKIAVQLCKAEDSILEAKRELTRLGLLVDSTTWSTMTRAAESLRMIDPEEVLAEMEEARAWAKVRKLAKMGGM